MTNKADTAGSNHTTANNLNNKKKHNSNTKNDKKATKSSSSAVPGVDEDALAPLWVAEKIVDCPCLICGCLLIFIIILTILDGLTFELSDESNRTWYVDEDSAVEDQDAWTLAEEAYSNAGGDDIYELPQTQQASDWTIFYMFKLTSYDKEIDSNNPSDTDYWILTPENLEIIIKYEDTIMQDPDWYEQFCYVTNTETYDCVYTSLARDIVEHFNYSYSNMTEEGIKNWVMNYYHTTESPGTVESSFNELFAQTNQTYLYRSLLMSGMPITTSIIEKNGSEIRTSKYRNDNDDDDEQTDEYDDWIEDLWNDITVDHNADLKDGNLNIVLFEGTIFGAQFNILLLESMGWVLAAIIAVAFWMTIHLQSLFLSISAIIEILLSFPFAFAIYRYILWIDHFDTLSMLIIFVLLGVGADDVFVFTDAWRQSLHFVEDKTNLKQRMSFSYRRAAKAMLVTQTTTFFAFLATATSRIMPISAFGIWAACIVFCNYLLVISMYPALLLLHFKYIRPIERRFCCCCCDDAEEHEYEIASPRKQRSTQVPAAQRQHSTQVRAGKAETPKNDEENIELTTQSEIDNKKQHISPKNGDNDNDEDSDDEGEPPQLERRQSTVEEQSIEYDCLERFFAVKWAYWVNKLKIVILLFFAVLFALAIWRGSEIEEQNEEEVWFPSGHYMRETLDLLDEFTSSEESGLSYVILLWGTNGVNRGSADTWDPEKYGKLKWDSNFDVSSYEAQEWFDVKCYNLSQNSLVFQQTSVTCVFDYFKLYLESMNETFPWLYTNDDMNNNNFSDTLQKELFAEKLYNFSKSEYASNINSDSLLFVETPIDRSDNKYYVKYIAIGAYANLKYNADLNDALDTQDEWDDWVNENFNNNEECPTGLKNGLQTSVHWCWLVTNREFVKSAIQGIAIALPLAFIVLIFSTQNWIMAIYATFDIIGVMACELAVMELNGWKFGVAESVAIVIVIGFSVDYVVHIANAYLESNANERHERTAFSLLTMGISVVSGAITTFLAGIFLSFPDIVFFFKMGVLIMTTIAFSLAWSMLFFIALLSLAGPQNETGHIPCGKIYRKICNKNNDE